MVFLFDPLFYHRLQTHPSPNVCQSQDMRQRLNQGQASLHGLCTFLFVSEGQVVNARLEGVAA
jgi:hypothetical protein